MTTGKEKRERERNKGEREGKRKREGACRELGIEKGSEGRGIEGRNNREGEREGGRGRVKEERERVGGGWMSASGHNKSGVGGSLLKSRSHIWF